jgi:hypothetical protein
MHRYLIFFRQWRHLFLLAALLALLIVEPIASSLALVESLFDALLVVVMAVLALDLAQDRVWRVIACVLSVPAATLSIGGHLLASSQQDLSVSIGHAIGAVFFVVVAGKIVGTILTSQELSLDSVFGAICGYLLLGVAWGLIYAMIQSVNPESFHVGEALRQQMDGKEDSRNVLIYYSFVTLSTVGYGDVTPQSDAARTLSWVEAVTGQLYLAVLITGLVSILVAKKMAVRDRP